MREGRINRDGQDRLDKRCKPIQDFKFEISNLESGILNPVHPY
jgi:hypothetical protein